MSDAQSIFEGLIAERGGRERFDVSGLAIANKLATLLASDTDGSAATIASLCELLPPKPTAGDETWDLSLLTDEQFKTLDRLCAIARGEKPPTPEKSRKGPPKRSYREHLAHGLALLLDQLDGEEEAARRINWRDFPGPSAEDVAAVRGAISDLLGLTVMLHDVAAVEIEDARFVERKVWLDREEAARAVARVHDIIDQPQREASPEPPPRSNVVEAPFGVFRVRRQSIFEEPRW
jgi:hypothetical protein